MDQTFFTNKIVRDVTDIFTLAAHPADGETFLRCYYKFGVPVTRAQALFACNQARRYGQGCWTALLNEDSIRPRTRAAMADVADGLARLPKMAADDAVRFLADQLGYGKYLDKNGMDRTKLAVLEMLGAQEPTPRHLLRRLEKLRSIIQNHENPPGCRFLLSTIHSAKGLEYKYVYIVGLEENLFPSQRAAESPDGIEEERRLFYVALTRAKVEATISYAEMRFKWGNMEFSRPSCFLREIDPKYVRADFGTGTGTDDDRPHRSPDGSAPSAIDELRRRFDYRFQQKQQAAGGNNPRDARPQGRPDPALVQAPRPSTDGMRRIGVRQAADGGVPLGDTMPVSGDYTVGQRVEHPKFGVGIVQRIETLATDHKLVVAFDGAGEKTLLAKFAKLTKL